METKQSEQLHTEYIMTLYASMDPPQPKHCPFFR